MIITFDLDLALREQTALVDRSQLFVLCDTTTAEHCLPLLQQTLALPDNHVLVLPAGEDHKNLSSLETVWRFLTDRYATRHSMLICLGGGVITDMGGLAAATYMRGMQCLNVPTTLLGMIDASAGGKTGINYLGIKNLIGVFRQPKETVVYPPFLRTLPAREFLSGWAEMVKHTLISSPLQVAALSAFDLHRWLAGPSVEQEEELSELITRSIEIKNYVVESDPDEQGMRKTLNFGHTVGHALEALCLEKSHETDTPQSDCLHGYAVLYGMVAELWLSHEICGFPASQIEPVIALMKEYYGKPVCPCRDYERLLQLMRHDKKNASADAVSFTLLHSVGNYRLDCTATPEQITAALDFLFNA